MLVAERSDFFCELKLPNDFEAEFRDLYTHVYGHCHVTFPYQEFLTFFGHCQVTFPYKEPLSFFGRCVQKVIVTCFSDSFVQKTTQQKRISTEGSRRRMGGKMAAVMLQVIPSFYTNYSKNSLFISANTYEKFIVSKEYSIARTDDKMCFLPNCRYHNILKR